MEEGRILVCVRSSTPVSAMRHTKEHPRGEKTSEMSHRQKRAIHSLMRSHLLVEYSVMIRVESPEELEEFG